MASQYKLSHYFFTHEEKFMRKLGRCNTIKKVSYQNQNLIVHKLKKCLKLLTLPQKW